MLFGHFWPVLLCLSLLLCSKTEYSFRVCSSNWPTLVFMQFFKINTIKTLKIHVDGQRLKNIKYVRNVIIPVYFYSVISIVLVVNLTTNFDIFMFHRHKIRFCHCRIVGGNNKYKQYLTLFVLGVSSFDCYLYLPMFYCNVLSQTLVMSFSHFFSAATDL